MQIVTLAYEAVAAWLGHEDLWAGGIWFDLLPQADTPRIYRSIDCGEVSAGLTSFQAARFLWHWLSANTPADLVSGLVAGWRQAGLRFQLALHAEHEEVHR